MRFNRKNMTTLRDHLVWLRDNSKAYKFNMDRWLRHPDYNESVRDVAWSIGDLLRDVRADKISAYECDTAACLGGFCALLGGASPDDEIEGFATRWLALNGDDACALFMGDWACSGLSSITLDQAIAHLTKLLDAGRAA